MGPIINNSKNENNSEIHHHLISLVNVVNLLQKLIGRITDTISTEFCSQIAQFPGAVLSLSKIAGFSGQNFVQQNLVSANSVSVVSNNDEASGIEAVSNSSQLLNIQN